MPTVIQQTSVHLPDKMILLPTEGMGLGDCLAIQHPAGPTPGLWAVLQADSIMQDKTFAIVRQADDETVVVCVRTAETIWPYALACTPSRNLIGSHRGRRYKELSPGQRMQVVNFKGHPWFAYQPLNLAGLRVYACKLSAQCGYKFAVSKKSYGADVLRVA